MNCKLIKHQWGRDEEGINVKTGEPIIKNLAPIYIKEITKNYFLLKNGTKCINVPDHNCCI